MKKIKHQIALAFIVIAVSSMSVIALISFIQAKKSLTRQVFDHLTSIKNIKGEEIKNYFQTLNNISQSFSENKTTHDAYIEFNTAYQDLQRIVLSIPEKNMKEMQLFRDRYYFKRYKENTIHDPLNFHAYVARLPKDPVVIYLQYLAIDYIRVHTEKGKDYLQLLDKYQNSFSSFIHYSGFVDVLMINSETGKVVYTDLKECDLGADINDSLVINPNVADLFEKLRYAKDPVTKALDYEVYFPSNNTPQSFLGCPIFENGKNIAVLLFQISSEKVNHIMTFGGEWEKKGLGKTGETYLIGDQQRMRSQSRFYMENKNAFIHTLQELHYPEGDLAHVQKYDNTIKNIRIQSPAAQMAIDGQSGTILCSDYRGVDILASYMPLDFFGYHWGIVAKMDTSEAFSSIYYLQFSTLTSFVLLMVVILIVSIYFSNYLTNPIVSLTKNVKDISEGKLETPVHIKRQDEIGTLAEGFKSMQSTIVRLVNDLKKSNFNLEERQKEIVDSIKYARKIQDSVLAGDPILRQHLKDYFVLFQPRDILSGDFYWATSHTELYENNVAPLKERQSFYFAICDSTGHGIPGAFMSLLNISFLNETITEKKISQPHNIFNEVRNSLIKTISDEHNYDGMDGVLLRFIPETNRVEYAASYNAPILVRNGEMIHCQADRIPVGKSVKHDPFHLYQLDVEKGDTLYIYTDGFSDQFGGEKNKKYKLKNFENFLLSIEPLEMTEQRQALENELIRWQGNNHQVDDILVIGIRF